MTAVRFDVVEFSHGRPDLGFIVRRDGNIAGAYQQQRAAERWALQLALDVAARNADSSVELSLRGRVFRIEDRGPIEAVA